MKRSSNRTIVMIAIFIATFMTSVETTIVTTALPTIISKLNGLSMQSWVFAMYLLTTAITTPIYGKLSDTVGRKPIFLTGLFVFSLGSLLCGFSPNIYYLILFRSIQGIGAGAVMPITFTIIADLFSYSKRSKMLAFNNTAWGVSALLGPIIGGFIVDQLNWHWIFFINVPLGILVFLLVKFGLHERNYKHINSKIDFKGIISLSILLFSILITFQSMGNNKISILSIIIYIIIFIIFLFLFYIFENKTDNPIIPLNLFKNKLFSIQIGTALLLSGIQIGFQIYFPIWLQSVYKVSASIAGLAVTPSPIMWIISAFFVGPLVKRFPPKYIILPTILVMSVTYIPLLFATNNFSIIYFYIIAGITGTGLGIIITINTLISQHIVPENKIGTASSMLTLGRTLGQTIMTGLFGLIFNLSINNHLNSQKLISLKEMNNFISSSRKITFSYIENNSMGSIIINSMHLVFLLVIFIFIVILIINIMDKNKKVIK